MEMIVLRIATSGKTHLKLALTSSSWENKGDKPENEKLLFCFYIRNTMQHSLNRIGLRD